MTHNETPNPTPATRRYVLHERVVSIVALVFEIPVNVIDPEGWMLTDEAANLSPVETKHIDDVDSETIDSGWEDEL